MLAKEKIIHSCVSDIAIIDIDNDGDDEIITIEPFHGNQIKIYKYIDTHYKVIYTYNHEIDFAHALCSGTINGQNSFLAGIRRKNAELVLIQWHKNQFVSTIIDEQVGPANILLINESNQDLILSANHTKNEAAIYIVPHKAVQ